MKKRCIAQRTVTIRRPRRQKRWVRKLKHRAFVGFWFSAVAGLSVAWIYSVGLV